MPRRLPSKLLGVNANVIIRYLKDWRTDGIIRISDCVRKRLTRGDHWLNTCSDEPPGSFKFRNNVFRIELYSDLCDWTMKLLRGQPFNHDSEVTFNFWELDGIVEVIKRLCEDFVTIEAVEAAGLKAWPALSGERRVWTMDGFLNYTFLTFDDVGVEEWSKENVDLLSKATEKELNLILRVVRNCSICRQRPAAREFSKRRIIKALLDGCCRAADILSMA